MQPGTLAGVCLPAQVSEPMRRWVCSIMLRGVEVSLHCKGCTWTCTCSMVTGVFHSCTIPAPLPASLPLTIPPITPATQPQGLPPDAARSTPLHPNCSPPPPVFPPARSSTTPSTPRPRWWASCRTPTCWRGPPPPSCPSWTRLLTACGALLTSPTCSSLW